MKVATPQKASTVSPTSNSSVTVFLGFIAFF